jgi:zinc transport system ATP-binding protein
VNTGQLMNKPEPGILVDISDVWVRFDGKWVLKSIYLKCYEGEILGIVGPNGGGKSTLLKVILGLIRPEKGTVRLFGKKPGKQSRLHVGYLPQISHAERSFPVTALDVVIMGLYHQMGLLSRLMNKHKKIALEKLEQVGMAEHADKPFGVLSGGQQQRVQIARALVSGPSLLVLDEPSTGVDSVGQEDFYELLAGLRDSPERISVIMVSHDIGVVTSHADRVACLNREIHYHGDTDSELDADIHQKVFGRNLKVMVHDPQCVSCRMRHIDDD